jgi:hypothetical protein
MLSLLVNWQGEGAQIWIFPGFLGEKGRVWCEQRRKHTLTICKGKNARKELKG